MDILKIKPFVDDEYYKPEFLSMLETHLQILKQDPDIRVISITEHQRDKYLGDFYGLLVELNVPYEYHWITTRFNGYSCSSDYNGSTTVVKIPSIKKINSLKSVFDSKES